MKRATFFIYLLLSSLLNSLFTQSIYAQGTASQTVNVSVNASVADCIDFTWGVKKILYETDVIPDLSWEEELTKMSIDFEKLWDPAEPDYPNRLFSPWGYVVVLWIAANEPYHIKQEETSYPNLYNRTTNNPEHNLDNSFIVIPEYNPEDKLISGASQGVLGSNVLTSPSLVKDLNNKELFQGKDSMSHILRLQYRLPLNSSISGWQPIPTNQPEGNYQGTVTISITR